MFRRPSRSLGRTVVRRGRLITPVTEGAARLAVIMGAPPADTATPGLRAPTGNGQTGHAGRALIRLTITMVRGVFPKHALRGRPTSAGTGGAGLLPVHMGAHPADTAIPGLSALRGRPTSASTEDAGLLPVRTGAHPADTAIPGRSALPGRPTSASTGGAGLLAVIIMAGRVRGIAGRALIRLTITTAQNVLPRPNPPTGIRLAQMGNCTTVITRDAVLRVVRMGALPKAAAVHRLPQQQPPLLPPPLLRFRVLKGRSISANTEDAGRFHAAASG